MKVHMLNIKPQNSFPTKISVCWQPGLFLKGDQKIQVFPQGKNLPRLHFYEAMVNKILPAHRVSNMLFRGLTMKWQSRITKQLTNVSNMKEEYQNKQT